MTVRSIEARAYKSSTYEPNIFQPLIYQSCVHDHLQLQKSYLRIRIKGH